MRQRTQLLAIACASVLLAAGVQAQSVYRIVGPDGRVSFTDRPPEKVSKGTRVEGGPPGAAASSAAAALPYRLRQPATRFPVVLYTGVDCAPCVNGRNLLINRGVPFTERTIASNDDIDALKSIAGDAGLPLLTLGAQQLKGFSDTEWSQYLDAAGYPKTSELPPSYQRPPATPLVTRSNSVTPSNTVPKPELARPAPAAPASPPGTRTPSNPAGIIF